MCSYTAAPPHESTDSKPATPPSRPNAARVAPPCTPSLPPVCAPAPAATNGANSRAWLASCEPRGGCGEAGEIPRESSRFLEPSADERPTSARAGAQTERSKPATDPPRPNFARGAARRCPLPLARTGAQNAGSDPPARGSSEGNERNQNAATAGTAALAAPPACGASSAQRECAESRAGLPVVARS